MIILCSNNKKIREMNVGWSASPPSSLLAHTLFYAELESVFVRCNCCQSSCPRRHSSHTNTQTPACIQDPIRAGKWQGGSLSRDAFTVLLTHYGVQLTHAHTHTHMELVEGTVVITENHTCLPFVLSWQRYTLDQLQGSFFWPVNGSQMCRRAQ